jgi:hypothetical protein
MKTKSTSLSVNEFQKMIASLAESSAVELAKTRARMQSLRDDPPG